MKHISLTIKNWLAENWNQCRSDNVSLWSIWESEYFIHNGECFPSSTSAKASAAVTQSSIGFTAMMVTISSIMNASSMASLWSIVNQVQLFFLF